MNPKLIPARVRAVPRRSFIGGIGLFSVALLGCAQGRAPAIAGPAPTPTPASGAKVGVVEGTVTWRERVALPANAELQVTLDDVSLADAAAVTLAEQRIPLADGRQPPHAFRLQYDPARIDPRNRYAVSARVVIGKKLLFINDTTFPAITQGAGNRVAVSLIRVQR